MHEGWRAYECDHDEPFQRKAVPQRSSIGSESPREEKPHKLDWYSPTSAASQLSQLWASHLLTLSRSAV